MRSFLLVLLTSAIVGPLSATEKPNVLFISVDDWNDWVGTYGDNQTKTPNRNRLAARGAPFDTRTRRPSIVRRRERR